MDFDKMTNEELMAENETLKKWKDGAERILDNYVKLLFGKDDQINVFIAKIKSLESEVNRLKSIEVTNKHNV
jgi:hypothetical protein